MSSKSEVKNKIHTVKQRIVVFRCRSQAFPITTKNVPML